MNKIKNFLQDDTAFYALLITLVAITAYGLGKYTTVPNIAVESQSQVSLVREAVSDSEKTENNTEIQLVASKNGTKYHYL